MTSSRCDQGRITALIIRCMRRGMTWAEVQEAVVEAEKYKHGIHLNHALRRYSPPLEGWRGS